MVKKNVFLLGKKKYQKYTFGWRWRPWNLVVKYCTKPPGASGVVKMWPIKLIFVENRWTNDCLIGFWETGVDFLCFGLFYGILLTLVDFIWFIFWFFFQPDLQLVVVFTFLHDRWHHYCYWQYVVLLSTCSSVGFVKMWSKNQFFVENSWTNDCLNGVLIEGCRFVVFWSIWCNFVDAIVDF